MGPKKDIDNLKYSSYDSFMAAVQKPFPLDKHSAESIMSKYSKLTFLHQAETLKDEGRYEEAFAKTYHLLSIIYYLKEKHKDQKYVELMCKSDMLKGVELAEKLSKKLKKLYDEKNVPIENGYSKGADAPLDESPVTKDTEDDTFVTNASLYTALKNSDKIVMFDVRTKEEFDRSHIDSAVMCVPVNIINISEDLIKKGLSAHALEQSMLSKGAVPQLWKDRGTFDKIVIIGEHSNHESVNILKNIFLNFDKVLRERKIQILKDGYSAWREAYLDLDRSKISNDTENLLECVTYDINIDSEDEAVVKIDRSTKPRPPEVKSRPNVDRSTKPQASVLNDERKALKDRLDNSIALEKRINELMKEVDEARRLKHEYTFDQELHSLQDEEINKLRKKSALMQSQIADNEKIIEQLKSQIGGPSSPTELKIIRTVYEKQTELDKIKAENDTMEEKSVPSHAVFNQTLVPKIPVIKRELKPKIYKAPPGIIGRSPGLTGLKNLGNTCYMNSILQCISNCNDLSEYFFNNVWQHDVNQNPRTKGSVARTVAEVVCTLWKGNTKCYAAWNFKETMGKIKSEYKTSEQQDSHEFFTYLMDWLHDDLNKVDHNQLDEFDQSSSEMEKEWIKFKSKNKSKIASLFYGLQKSTLTCLACGEKSITYEPFSNLSLSLPVGDNVTLPMCIQEYLKGEQISGWRCPKCKKERTAEKSIEFSKLPVILVVHLKRFSFMDVHSSKRTTLVKFPLKNLQLPSTELKSYCLYGVSNHYGTMEAGHYTAFCKNQEYDRWYRFDDHEVSEISPDRVETNAAYILFYSSNIPIIESS